MHMSKAPVKIVRGSGQYMFDHEQVEYLDCVNIQAHGIFSGMIGDLSSDLFILFIVSRPLSPNN